MYSSINVSSGRRGLDPIANFVKIGDGDDVRMHVNLITERDGWAFGVDEAPADITVEQAEAVFLNHEDIADPKGLTGTWDEGTFTGSFFIDGSELGEWGIGDFDVDVTFDPENVAVIAHWLRTGEDSRR